MASLGTPTTYAEGNWLCFYPTDHSQKSPDPTANTAVCHDARAKTHVVHTVIPTVLRRFSCVHLLIRWQAVPVPLIRIPYQRGSTPNSQ